MKTVPVVTTWVMLSALLALCAPSAQAAGAPTKRVFSSQELQNAVIPGLDANARTRALEHIQAMRSAKAAQSANAAKINPVLRTFAEQSAGNDQATHPLLRVRDGSIKLKLTLDRVDAAALQQLQQLGLHVSGSSPGSNQVFAACPVAELAGALPSLSATAMIKRVEPVLGEMLYAGSVLSEGDAALGADAARARFGFDGSGVKVCVISDGTAGAVESMLSGNLPQAEDGSPAVDLCPLNDNSGAEGTAMLEIVHDLAPGAELGFCPAFSDNGQQGLADAITYLAEVADCDVIVDDVAYLTEPYFEDGVVAQAVDRAFWRGASYFSSAGNGADNHYEADYLDLNPDFDLPISLVNLHDFGTAAGGQPDVDWGGIVASGGNFFAAFLQWNDKFGEAANDYDVYIFDEFGFPAGGVDPDPTDDIAPVFPLGGNGVAAQDGDDDPSEIAFIVNNVDPIDPFGAIRQFFIVIDRFSGDSERVLEMNFNGFFSLTAIEDFNVREGSIWGHAAARGAISVAATGAVVNNDGQPNPGLDIIEPFSSVGPSRIFYDSRGRFRERKRLTPTLTATDGVSVTGFGGFPTTFFGTSASAPHAAAVAALMLDARSFLGPIGVRLLLGLTAEDRGERRFDTTWGRGLIDAERAVEVIAPRRRWGGH